jgi:hypothetical protein
MEMTHQAVDAAIIAALAFQSASLLILTRQLSRIEGLVRDLLSPITKNSS